MKWFNGLFGLKLGKRPKAQPFFKSVELKSVQKEEIWVTAQRAVKKRIMNDARKRTVFALGKGLLATLREFESEGAVTEYLRIKKEFDKILSKPNPKFEYVPIQILAQKGNQLIERVFPGISQYSLSQGISNRYDKMTERRIRKSGITRPKLKEMAEDVIRMLYRQIEQQPKLMLPGKIDYAGNNFLILGYNEKTGKLIISFTDILLPTVGGSKSTWK